MGGELPLRYCSGSFACRVPTWGLPVRGHVQDLFAEFAGDGDVPRSGHVSRAQLPGLVGDAGVLGGRRSLGSGKRVRLHRKTPAHLAGFGGDGSSRSRPRVWGLRVPGIVTNDAKVPRLHQGDEAHGPLDMVVVG